VTSFRLLVLSSLLLASTAWPDNESRLREIGNTSSARLVATAGSGAPRRVYIVQLRTPSAAEQFASIDNALARKSLDAAPASFDKNNAAVQSYTAELGALQDKVLSQAGSDIKQIYSYRYSLNGFAARMTESQARKVEHLDEVLAVWEDEVRPLATNYSPQFLGLFEPTVGLRGAPGLDGDGVIVAVIDSGITPEHPALKDTREADRPSFCRSALAETLLGLWLCKVYREQDDVLLYDPPENWNGTCQSGVRFEETACNNKLIGARYFIDGARSMWCGAGNPTECFDNGEIESPRDADGHGTHTATTVAGHRVNASIFGTLLGAVQGIAPRARIAAYKACWLRPGDLRASCNTSDLTNAIDMAVADGVHIINYSVGSSLRLATAPDDIALMAAAKAGILAAVAAGNEGPNLGTIGSPAGAPWVITAAASSRDGQRFEEALEVLSPPTVAGKYAVQEASFTPRLIDNDPIEGNLVLVDDNDDTLDDGSAGTTFDACEALVNDGDISGNIAYIQRGGCSFQTKIDNAETAGAIAVVVFNIAGRPFVMTADPTQLGLPPNIPALMIGQADGNLILDEINADQTVNLVLDKGFFLSEQETGNIMGAFSARGPAPVQDILKPDVTAPGINILAGFTPDAANSVAGENFAYITGTSMATPHVAGVAALLRQAHPDWSPAALKSALMTTARQDINQQDGATPANPFDFGAGHIVPNKANDPGLVYDVTDDEYDAFACGTASPAVDQARCDALSAGGLSFDAEDLNQPSITIARLANNQTITRRVTNVSDEAETYVASVVAPPEMSVAVVPTNLTVGPGQSATFDVTFTYVSGPLDLWRFGSLTWSSSNHDVRSVLGIQPVALTAPTEVSSFGGTGDISFPVDFGYTGSYTPGVHGLRKPLVISGFVDEDDTKTFTFRGTNGVVATRLIDVPANQAYLRFALFDELTDGNDDLDMYVYYCIVADPAFIKESECTKLGESGGPTSSEEFNIIFPAGGQYLVLVHGFATDNVAGGDGAIFTLLGWSFGLVDDQGNMTASGPGFVNAGTTENVDVNWFGLEPDTIYLGGISHNTPQGLAGLTVIRIRN
jgi:subtilisin family serine protease